MTPLMLRQLWSLVDATQVALLLNLDDASLVQWLLRQFRIQQPLNPEEITILSSYIQSKLSLIRDLAHQKD
ncbi:hypothetical protein C7B65_18015 [Phormidesmis priestleyi ULC007]|uniref:Uncharacterized protein n=1 Tax=Phormidesmis priestleyi ULC007 TaxID=1920490 RepID=A0A2T1DAR7_9CYAN|nr:hypothetical protein [Phormidesmis priestleyi]PSB17585.1 hypothetical protein C7B65_18015 [Phormidesmis priestleyi ULC007]PZO48462.1 MAG: hypothetical protein DCF14_16715 [Phormidesmis priestleyi]